MPSTERTCHVSKLRGFTGRPWEPDMLREIQIVQSSIPISQRTKLQRPAGILLCPGRFSSYPFHLACITEHMRDANLLSLVHTR